MKNLIYIILALTLLSCEKPTTETINSTDMAMTIKQDFEADIIAGQSPNFLILQDVDTYIDVGYTIQGDSFSNRYYADVNKEIELNLLEVTKQVYIYNDDTFDYSTNITYTKTDKYHIAELDINIQDKALIYINKKIFVLNGVLQVGDATNISYYLDKNLTEGMINMPAWRKDGVNYPISESKLGYSAGDYLIQRSITVVPSEIINVNCGVYIKWLNHKGKYAYWFFNSVEETIKTKSKGNISNHYTNRVTAHSDINGLGFDTSKTKSINTRVDDVYINEFVTLLDSPEVYIYTGDLIKHTWIKVGISSSAKIKTRNNKHKIVLKLTMPTHYTIKK